MLLVGEVLRRGQCATTIYAVWVNASTPLAVQSEVSQFGEDEMGALMG